MCSIENNVDTMEPNNHEKKCKPVSVVVRMMKYETDSSYLIDFESNKYVEDRITITHSLSELAVYIVKNNRKLVTIAEEEYLETYLQAHQEATVLARLIWSEKGCFLCHPGSQTLNASPSMSFVVMSNRLCRKVQGRMAATKPMNHIIKEGDRIKFGRSTLIVRCLTDRPVNSLTYVHDLLLQNATEQTQRNDIGSMQSDAAMTIATQTGTRNAEDGNNDDAGSDSTMTYGEENIESRRAPDNNGAGDITTVASARTTPNTEEDNQRICRICLEDEASGPLVVPCQCKGSMKYVHLSCVRTWVQGRLKVNDDNGGPQLSYFLQKLRCELCNFAYPSYINVGTVLTDFLGIEEPTPPYAVFEPEDGNATGLYMVTVVDGTTGVGRGSQSAIILHDISVSRMHALIKYRDGQFILEDQGSKFGTLIKLDKEFKIPVQMQKPVILRIGAEILCITAKPVRALGSLCCCSFNSKTVRIVV